MHKKVLKYQKIVPEKLVNKQNLSRHKVDIVFFLLEYFYSSPVAWGKDLLSEACFRSIACFGDPQYLSRTSPHFIQCAWNSRFWNFEFRKTLLQLRNLWDFAPYNRFRPVPSSSFNRSAKNRHASKIRSHVGPRGNQELCLTTPECPGFRHHPHERPEFLRPLLLLFLRCMISRRRRSTAEMPPQVSLVWEPAEGPASPPDCALYMPSSSTGLLDCYQCSVPSSRLIVSLPSLKMVCPSRGSCSSVVGCSHSSPCPACCAGMGISSHSALDCLIGTLSVFDGVVISIKNSS